VLDQVVPHMGAVGFDHVAEIVLGQCTVHGRHLGLRITMGQTRLSIWLETS
jgi:hypothetical protein